MITQNRIALSISIISLVTMLLAVASFAAAAENWAGIEGGGPRHNTSAVDINPAGIDAAWIRSFAAVPLRNQEGPADEMHLPGGRGSLNLTVLDGRICLAAADGADYPEGYYCVVLDAADGKTLNNIAVRSNTGNERFYRWPYNTVSMSGDTLPGIVNLAWDGETGILFIAQGAYHSAYTAYDPLANAASYEKGRYQQGVPAYLNLAQDHPDYQDAFGRRRADMRTILGIDFDEEGMAPWAWGLSGFFATPVAEGEKPKKYDTDWEGVFGRQGSSYYNTSAFFSVEADGPLMGICKGAGWGHNIAGDAYIFNKHTGMKTVTSWPRDPMEFGNRLRPFNRGGVLIANGRIFCAGPSQDIDGDRQMGTRRPEGQLPKVDQGLYLWAYDYTMQDKMDNDGVEGLAAKETSELKLAFAHKFLSTYEPDPNEIDSYGQSYYETDGFFRNKAMLADGKSIWFAWKPSLADPVELIRADEKDRSSWSLEVGRNRKGSEVWPKMSLTEIDGKKYIAYFTGYGKYRKRVMVDNPEEVLKQYTHKGNRWEELSERDRKGFIGQAERVGVWSDTLYDPRGPAEIAVFDASAGKLAWTYNISENHPSIPANGFWGYLDKSCMVVSGKHAWLGWVDVTGDEALLKLLAFDLTAPSAKPVEKSIKLGFESGDNRKSALFDLVAADGALYALVTQSDRLWIRDPRWKNQLVVKIAEK